ncbi:hypothetical protein K661_01275 [Piscirickettsia salmonis LF-89 = ATCC VR-1361]|nr:hypothetical protein K661_01275 [Piscirickettsia salmonis LF-89 = ATCC VR-1361]
MGASEYFKLYLVEFCPPLNPESRDFIFLISIIVTKQN